MGITTTYACDNCPHTQSDDKQMWSLVVRLAHHGHDHNYSTTKREVLWCRACVEKLGLLPITKKEENTDVPIPPITIEDMIREIVASEMSCQPRAAL